jgi:hypothetical protein
MAAVHSEDLSRPVLLWKINLGPCNPYLMHPISFSEIVKNLIQISIAMVAVVTQINYWLLVLLHKKGP